MADNSCLQDDELYLPRTVVNKLIKEIVPNIRVSTDARDLLLNCCTEFIHLLASEASDISERQQKKVISPEHVVEALTTLGFQEYVPDVKAVHKEYKEQASKHRKRGKSKLDRLGIPEEELARQQQQLFDEARQQQMESELMEQQQLQHPHLIQSYTAADTKAVKSASPVSSQNTTQILATVTSNAEKRSGTDRPSNASISNASKDQVAHVTQQSPSLIKPPVTQGSIPQNAAITVASLQATSNLLQQAIAMASAQMAASNNAQIQGQSELTPQNVLLQQPSLQAALAAHMAAAQVQSKSHLLPQAGLLPKPVPPLPLGTSSEPVAQAVEHGQATTLSKNVTGAKADNAAVTSQELSVAQMMMTLAQASNKNTLAHSGDNSQLSKAQQQHAPNNN